MCEANLNNDYIKHNRIFLLVHFIICVSVVLYARYVHIFFLYLILAVMMLRPRDDVLA